MSSSAEQLDAEEEQVTTRSRAERNAHKGTQTTAATSIALATDLVNRHLALFGSSPPPPFLNCISQQLTPDAERGGSSSSEAYISDLSDNESDYLERRLNQRLQLHVCLDRQQQSDDSSRALVVLPALERASAQKDIKPMPAEKPLVRANSQRKKKKKAKQQRPAATVAAEVTVVAEAVLLQKPTAAAVTCSYKATSYALPALAGGCFTGTTLSQSMCRPLVRMAADATMAHSVRLAVAKSLRQRPPAVVKSATVPSAQVNAQLRNTKQQADAVCTTLRLRPSSEHVIRLLRQPSLNNCGANFELTAVPRRLAVGRFMRGSSEAQQQLAVCQTVLQVQRPAGPNDAQAALTIFLPREDSAQLTITITNDTQDVQQAASAAAEAAFAPLIKDSPGQSFWLEDDDLQPPDPPRIDVTPCPTQSALEVLGSASRRSSISPGQKVRRSVSFADQHKQELSQVRILHEPSDMPPLLGAAAFRHLQLHNDNLAQHRRGSTHIVHQWKPLFQQPIGDFVQFVQSLKTGNVKLENGMLRYKPNDGEHHQLLGTVRVNNICFEKQVFLRYTWNNWLTSHDALCSWTSGGSSYDTYAFTLPIPLNDDVTQTDVTLVCFCVGFNAGGSHFWDNNGGDNYLFRLEASQQSTSTLSVYENNDDDDRNSSVGGLSVRLDDESWW